MLTLEMSGSVRQRCNEDSGHLQDKLQLHFVSYLLLYVGRHVMPNPSAGVRGHRRS